MYWRRVRAHDKTRELCSVVCSAGAFTGCVDNVKSEKITNDEKMRRQKFDKAINVDKANKG